MKKAIVWLLVAACVLSVPGCGEGAAGDARNSMQPDSTIPETASQTQYTEVSCQALQNNQTQETVFQTKYYEAGETPMLPEGGYAAFGKAQVPAGTTIYSESGEQDAYLYDEDARLLAAAQNRTCDATRMEIIYLTDKACTVYLAYPAESETKITAQIEIQAPRSYTEADYDLTDDPCDVKEYSLPYNELCQRFDDTAESFRYCYARCILIPLGGKASAEEWKAAGKKVHVQVEEGLQAALLRGELSGNWEDDCVGTYDSDFTFFPDNEEAYRLILAPKEPYTGMDGFMDLMVNLVDDIAPMTLEEFLDPDTYILAHIIRKTSSSSGVTLDSIGDNGHMGMFPLLLDGQVHWANYIWIITEPGDTVVVTGQSPEHDIRCYFFAENEAPGAYDVLGSESGEFRYTAGSAEMYRLLFVTEEAEVMPACDITVQFE